MKSLFEQIQSELEEVASFLELYFEPGKSTTVIHLNNKPYYVAEISESLVAVCHHKGFAVMKINGNDESRNRLVDFIIKKCISIKLDEIKSTC